MNFLEAYKSGHTYEEFLNEYASDAEKAKWRNMEDRISLKRSQQDLIGVFTRELKVLCMAGVWCGDCVDQCPILEKIASFNDCIQVRYVDRDANEELKEALKVCGGARVPGVIFMNEDGQKLGQYGDRTLAKYQSMASSLEGAACSTGLGDSDELIAKVVQEWIDQFERVHWMARLSPRLREKHGD